MDFQEAINNGYYFDRCIDLEFFNIRYEPLARLKCPTRGMKPSITIKGNFIAGNYSVDSYISIQNMAFDIDINAVAFILASMYYSGIEESTSVNNPYSQNLRHNRHEILYSVQFADQEKEPPHRAVRFQCVAASEDITRIGINLYVVGGELAQKKSGITLKNKKTSTTLLNVVKNVAELYNKNIKETVVSKKLQNLMFIYQIVIDNDLKDEEINIEQKEFTLVEFIRLLNAYTSNNSLVKWDVKLTGKNIVITKLVPDNWKLIAKARGFTTDEDLDEFYEQEFVNNYSVSVVLKENSDSVYVDATKAIPLNFVKSATRSENVITCTTMFDDRVYPGCKLKIKGSSIMGRVGFGRPSRSGSRILTIGEVVEFRATGAIEYLFSTTEDSYMKIQGPVLEQYKDRETPTLEKDQS